MGTLIIITIAQFSITQLRCDLPDLCCPHLVFVFPPNCDITTLFSSLWIENQECQAKCIPHF